MNEDRELSLDGSNAKPYQIEKDSLRHRLIFLLATEKRFIGAQELAGKLETSSDRIRKTVGQIRNMVKKNSNVSGYSLISTDESTGGYSNKKNCPRCEIKIEDMENPKYLHYIYYHCTKRKNPNCLEGSLEEDKMDEYAANYFGTHLEISPALRDWCLKHLDELDQQKKQNEFEIRASLESEKKSKEKEYEELIKMKMKGLIEEDDFRALKISLKTDMERIENSLKNLSGSGNTETLEKAKKAFNLAVGIAEIFRSGKFEEKTETLSETCSNLTLKDKILSITNDDLFSIIINGLLEAKDKNPQFEPKNIQDTSEQNESFYPSSTTLLPILVTFRTLNWRKIKEELNFLSPYKFTETYSE